MYTCNLITSKKIATEVTRSRKISDSQKHVFWGFGPKDDALCKKFIYRKMPAPDTQLFASLEFF